MDRSTLARQVAEQVDGLSIRLASAAVDATCDAISAALARDEAVTLSNFGTFKTRQRKSRQTLHPRTRQPVMVPAARLPAFVPSPKLQRLMQESTQDSADTGSST
ncbi:MAG: HU family DNA-binding protein [Synechococcus sp.]